MLVKLQTTYQIDVHPGRLVEQLVELGVLYVPFSLIFLDNVISKCVLGHVTLNELL